VYFLSLKEAGQGGKNEMKPPARKNHNIMGHWVRPHSTDSGNNPLGTTRLLVVSEPFLGMLISVG
jgi:hypothetical protein